LQKCVPDQPACDGDVATTCDATGLEYIGQRLDCAATDEVCVAGDCKPVICTPNVTYCDGSELRSCGPNGGSSTLLDTCLVSEFCDATNAVCAPDGCTAGAVMCNDAFLTQCKADGSGPEAGGTNCAQTGQACDRGACRDLICTPNARLCDAGDVQLCNALGTAWAPYDNCRAREFCDATQPTGALCASDLCPQGGNGCQSEHLAQCNADGSGFTSVGNDCASSGKVCDFSGSCLTTALDDLGAGGAALPATGSSIHLDLFRVRTARTLVQLEAAIVPQVAGAVTWVLYRSDAELGTYTLIDQINTSGTVIDGYLSSGATSVALAANKYYLLGVAIKGPHNASVLEGGSPAPVSFGQMLGGFTYVAGAVPTIPNKVEVSDGLLGDDVALKVRTKP
jgi:hypothetical protein